MQDKAHSAAGTAQDKSKDLHGAAKDTVSKAVAGMLKVVLKGLLSLHP